MKNNLSSYGEGNIKHPKKKFEKVVRVPPEGYESSNDFFEDVFMDKDMIWMGQNTNHLHGDIIADAMASCAKAKEYCKYPPPNMCVTLFFRSTTYFKSSSWSSSSKS